MKIGIGTFCLVFSLSLAFPSLSSAQVVVSEIMYDVSSTVGADDTREWVEIFNAGPSSVSIAGWKINDGSNHVLNEPPANGGIGSFTLQSGAYAIIADDATTFRALYPSAVHVIDTSLDLNNTADTIVLVNADGASVDAVSYAKEMGAAGDGNSLHRGSASSAALSSGTPTPGTGNLTAQTPVEGTNTETSTTTSQTSTATQTTQTVLSPVSSYVPPPLPQLFADAGEDREVIVGADVKFVGRAYNRQKEILEKVRYLWNFGDGSTGEGPSVLHHFIYPGRYVVILDIAENRDAASDRIIVRAKPAALAFSALPDGGVAIENRSGDDLDLSYWIVRSFGQKFMLPENFTILGGETLRIQQKTLGFISGLTTELAYPNGALALKAGESVGESAVSEEAIAPPTIAASATLPEEEGDPLEIEIASAESDEPESNVVEIDEDVEEATSTQVAAAASISAGSSKWWLAAVGIATAGAGAMYVAKRFGRKEWNIIEG